MTIQRRDPVDITSASQPSLRWAHLIKTLSALSRQLRKMLSDQTGVHALSDSEFLLLLGCGESPDGGLSQNDLARWLGLSAGQISGLVEFLRRRELLSKQRCPRDRRRQLWTLTPHGRQTLRAVMQNLDATLANSARQWPASFFQELQVVLEGLMEIAGPSHSEHSESPPPASSTEDRGPRTKRKVA